MGALDRYITRENILTGKTGQVHKIRQIGTEPLFLQIQKGPVNVISYVILLFWTYESGMEVSRTGLGLEAGLET